MRIGLMALGLAMAGAAVAKPGIDTPFLAASGDAVAPSGWPRRLRPRQHLGWLALSRRRPWASAT